MGTGAISPASQRHRAVAGDQANPAADHLEAGRAGALVLAEVGAGEERDDRLAQTVHRVRQGVRRPAGGRGRGRLQQFGGEGGEVDET